MWWIVWPILAIGTFFIGLFVGFIYRREVDMQMAHSMLTLAQRPISDPHEEWPYNTMPTQVMRNR